MWYIIYPGGKKSEISLKEINKDSEYDVSAYSLASRRNFTSKTNAEDYARKLATNNHKFFIGSNFDGNYYLD